MAFFFFANPPPATPPEPTGGTTNVRFRWQLGTCCACAVKAFKCGVQPREWSLRMTDLPLVPAASAGWDACEQWVLDQLGTPMILAQDVLLKRGCAWSKAIELAPPDNGSVRPTCPRPNFPEQKYCPGGSTMAQPCVNRIIAFTLWVADHWQDLPQFQHGGGYQYPLPVGDFGCASITAWVWNYCQEYVGYGDIAYSDKDCEGYSEHIWYAPLNALIDPNNPQEIDLLPVCDFLGCHSEWMSPTYPYAFYYCTCNYDVSHLRITPVPMP